MSVPKYKEAVTGETLKEREVIQRILWGEKELYELLVRRNNQKLYRVVRSYIKNEQSVEDVMQNTYTKAYEKLHQFRLDSSFSTWLIRIGINESLRRIKKNGKMYHISHQTTEDYTNSLLELPEKNQMNPQNDMIRKENKKILEDAIDQLDEKYRVVYIMKEVEGMSIKEVATILNLTKSNVKVRLHRSRSMLKEILYALSADKNIFEFGFGRCDQMTEKVMNSI